MTGALSAGRLASLNGRLVQYMANGGGFMGNWEARAIMYGICALFGALYAVDAVREVLSPERSAQMIEMVGTAGYYALTGVRCLVCAWVAVSFGRMAWKAFTERD